MAKTPVINGPWMGGINSIVDPIFLPDNQVQWSVNTLNRGGSYQTRPGYNLLHDSTGYTLIPRGMTVFSPRNSDPVLVKAVGNTIKVSRYPYTVWTTLAGITLDSNSESQVHFETCVKGAITHEDGTLEIIEPYPVLLIQTGKNKAAYWDGAVARHLDPTKTAALSETPIGTWMKWIGSRLWVAQDNQIRVSNILDPLKFTEEDIISEGGTLSIPGNCTGLGNTADFQAMLAFTTSTSTAFNVSILDRTLWQLTPGFQKVILPDIGCVAGKTIINQYGITWWMAQGGIIGLDAALQTYRTSKIRYKDQNMSRSKSNISQDISGACAGSFENLLVFSVPSGDTYNAHTWVMDQSVLDDINSEQPPVWASCWTGTRPVEWVSENIRGQNRCFFLSRDYPPNSDTTHEFRSDVWEAFCGAKFDIGIDGSARTLKPIECSMETKMLSKDAGYKTFDHFKVCMRELSGQSHIDGFYASTHSGYKQVLDKDIVATTNPLRFNTSEDDLDPIIPSYIRQTRTIRSSADQAQSRDNDDGVESIYTRNKDTSFSILLQWNGQISIPYLTLFYDTKGEQVDGTVENDETKDRFVSPDGTNTITTADPIAPSVVSGTTSSHISVLTPRWEENVYKSLT